MLDFDFIFEIHGNILLGIFPWIGVQRLKKFICQGELVIFLFCDLHCLFGSLFLCLSYYIFISELHGSCGRLWGGGGIFRYFHGFFLGNNFHYCCGDFKIGLSGGCLAPLFSIYTSPLSPPPHLVDSSFIYDL